ncbi:MAG: hypothetical protein II054_00355, partial [Treponema sp.]|nr:hypothetical protein [Treponema sp.]
MDQDSQTDAVEIVDMARVKDGAGEKHLDSSKTVEQYEKQIYDLQQMLEIGWRTARLCAWETYMDCPYYEQLQYLGDTRIQALVTLYNSKDDRLVKNFLHLADVSRSADGITKSRYPTTLPQHIQP